MMPKFEYVIKPLEVKKKQNQKPQQWQKPTPLKTKQPPQKLSQKPA